MQDIMHGFQIGDRVLFDDQDDELGLEKGDEGIVESLKGNSLVVNFYGKCVEVKWFCLKQWTDVAKLDPKQRIQYDYAEWVDEVSDVCDWKTSISMDEVQSKYSQLAIQLAIKELSSIAEISTGETLRIINERIKYLENVNS
jgi:hypothetical protein